jgi:hypothetical protein
MSDAEDRRKSPAQERLLTTRWVCRDRVGPVLAPRVNNSWESGSTSCVQSTLMIWTGSGSPGDHTGDGNGGEMLDARWREEEAAGYRTARCALGKR